MSGRSPYPSKAPPSMWPSWLLEFGPGAATGTGRRAKDIVIYTVKQQVEGLLVTNHWQSAGKAHTLPAHPCCLLSTGYYPTCAAYTFVQHSQHAFNRSASTTASAHVEQLVVTIRT